MATANEMPNSNGMGKHVLFISTDALEPKEREGERHWAENTFARDVIFGIEKYFTTCEWIGGKSESKREKNSTIWYVFDISKRTLMHTQRNIHLGNSLPWLQSNADSLQIVSVRIYSCTSHHITFGVVVMCFWCGGCCCCFYFFNHWIGRPLTESTLDEIHWKVQAELIMKFQYSWWFDAVSLHHSKCMYVEIIFGGENSFWNKIPFRLNWTDPFYSDESLNRHTSSMHR